MRPPRYPGREQTRLPPGPRNFPIIGSMHRLHGSLPHHSLRALAREHGPLMHLKLGQVGFVVATSREAAEEITKTHDLNFAYRPALACPRALLYDFSDIVFAPYGAHWRELRKICVLELLSAKRVKSSSIIRDQEVSNLIREILISITPRCSSTPIDLSGKLELLSNGIVSRSTVGDKLRQPVRLVSAVKEALSLMSGFSVADVFPSGPLKFVDFISGFRYKLERVRRDIDGILSEIIEEHMAKMTDNHDQRAEDLVDVLLRLMQDGELDFPITLNNVKAVVLDMLVAGTETSASTSVWAIAEMMKNPRVMKHAQEEVREAAARRNVDRVEESDVDELSYLKLVIKETLRLHPPAPLLLPRECKDTCRVMGYEIPAGSRVMVNVWALGRDPQYWEDAEEFKPERFEGNSVDFKGSNFEFLPFGAGRRICPGMASGLATVGLALARLLFHFDWELPDGKKPHDVDMTERFGITAARRSKLCLMASPRPQY